MKNSFEDARDEYFKALNNEENIEEIVVESRPEKYVPVGASRVL